LSGGRNNRPAIQLAIFSNISSRGVIVGRGNVADFASTVSEVASKTVFGTVLARARFAVGETPSVALRVALHCMTPRLSQINPER